MIKCLCGNCYKEIKDKKRYSIINDWEFSYELQTFFCSKKCVNEYKQKLINTLQNKIDKIENCKTIFD